MARKSKVKIVELIRDWDLWPRFDSKGVDRTNVSQMKEAILAGVVLPAIVVCRESKRIIDGFHRVEVYLALYGENHKIPVEYRDYADDKERYLDAVRMNAAQGLKLSPKDRAHAIVKGIKKEISVDALAVALGMRAPIAESFLEKRTAVDGDGESVVLAHGAGHLAGKTLSEAQKDYASSSSGILPIVHARILLKALKANCMPLTELELEVLKDLRDEIDVALENHRELEPV